MDDIASQILHGCKLAGELETNLPNLLNQSQHNLLIDSCDQIVQTFSKAIRQLTTSKEDRSSGHGFIENEEEKTDDVVCAGVGATIGREEDPLAPAEKQMGSPDTSESVEMIKPHRIGPGSGIRRAEEPSTDAAVMLIGTSGESSIGAASMTSNKMKKRLAFTPNEMGRNVKDLLLRVRKQMDELGDDGYNWRKYGEKSNLGAKFPRSYYRCSQRDCGAKKRVQRLQEDPTTFEVVYNGPHTCRSSFSIPCNNPPTNLEHNKENQSQSISIQLGTGSSDEVQCSATNANVYSKDKTQRVAFVMDECDSSSSSVHIHP
ncbi:WRKY domain-containing protein [Dioscorea alata]|uniref:WRKY domain-containing protein n=1 Tax=Dioscorea alata TaxID=55571 RepID=A0ACB7U783_DIOAL|nr:WRKY domain-containing protein [Dioscorea alata]